MNERPTRWEDCGREDLNMIPTMIAAGYTPEFSPQDQRWGRTELPNGPHDGVSFAKGNISVSKRYEYGTGEHYWRIFELIDGHWIQRGRWDTLNDYLNENK